MQAVLLCAGQSSRFFPFNTTHKSMVSLLGKPLLGHAISGLRSVGIVDCVVVVGPDESGAKEVRDFVSDGSSWGVRIQIVEEPDQAGMGRALQVATPLLTDDFVVVNPYHVQVAGVVTQLFSVRPTANGVITLTPTKQPWEYGVAEIDALGMVKTIVEKPEKGTLVSELRLVGLYVLPIDFLPYLDRFSPAQSHFEQALSAYAQEHTLASITLPSAPPSLKYPWGIFPLLHELLDTVVPTVHSTATVAKTAIIDGPVVIDAGATIHEYAVIKGPVYIGRNATVGSHTLVREYSSLEEGSSVGCFTELRQTILGPRSSLHSGFIGDSVIGADCRIGAGFCTANRRIDREGIKVTVKGTRIQSEQTRLGVFIGNGSKVGINVSTMPGAVIAPGSVIKPGTTIH